jgi:hypothetical protein
MQEENKPTERELLDDASAHFVASTFVIGHHQISQPHELERAKNIQASASAFLKSRGYTPEEYDFKELPPGAPDYLLRLTGKDARIPNYEKNIYWIVRGGRISDVLAGYYPSFYNVPR